MMLVITRWLLRTGLQWICGALLAFAVTSAQHYWRQPQAVSAMTHVNVPLNRDGAR